MDARTYPCIIFTLISLEPSTARHVQLCYHRFIAPADEYLIRVNDAGLVTMVTCTSVTMTTINQYYKTDSQRNLTNYASIKLWRITIKSFINHNFRFYMTTHITEVIPECKNLVIVLPCLCQTGFSSSDADPCVTVFLPDEIQIPEGSHKVVEKGVYSGREG